MLIKIDYFTSQGTALTIVTVMLGIAGAVVIIIIFGYRTMRVSEHTIAP